MTAKQLIGAYVMTPIVVAMLAACSQPRSEAETIHLPLSAVDGFAFAHHPAPIEIAFHKYREALIAIEGIRLGPGLPPGLGSHQYVGLHEPPRSDDEFRVFLSGNVPPEHGERYRVMGRIVPAGSSYEIAVEYWEVMPR